MRTLVVVAILVVLAAGGGYYGLEVYPQQQFRSGLDRSLATLPPGTTATYQDAHYSLLTHKAVVTGLTVHGQIPGTPPQPFDVTTGTIETDNPNLDFPASWSQAVAAPTAFGPNTALPVAGSVSITGITVHSAPVNLTEDSLRITNVRIFPWALQHGGVPSWKDMQTALTPERGPAALASLQTILRAEAAAVLGVAYDSYAAGSVKVTESLPEITVQYEVRNMAGGAFDRGILTGASGDGITFRSGNVGTVTIDRVAMGPIDIRQPMTRLMNGETLSAELLDGLAIGRIDYSGITAQLPGKPATHIGGMWLGPVAFTGSMPVAGKLGWTDISVARSQVSEPQVRDVFDRLGLETMTVSFAFAYDWNPALGRASIHDTVLKVNELGTLTLAAELSNVVANPAGLAQLQLAHARLRFDDASLVDRLVRAGAAQSGADPAVYRQQIVTMVKQDSSNGVGSPAMTAACDAAGNFIASPHSLTVELAPAQPVQLLALKDMKLPPAMLANMLGLVVSASQ